MELDEVMRTTFACREWTDEPVSDEMLHEVLDVARFAPSGGNRQGGRVVIVRDPDLRQALVAPQARAMGLYIAQREAGEAPRQTVEPSSVDATAAREATDLSTAMVAGLMSAPVVLVVAVDLSVVASTDAHLQRVGVVSGASIYPLVWNILLAARNRGLGGVMTTAIADDEAEVQRILGIPAHYAVAALIPIGHPVRQLAKLTRDPVERFTTIDTFDGDAFEI